MDALQSIGDGGLLLLSLAGIVAIALMIAFDTRDTRQRRSRAR